MHYNNKDDAHVSSASISNVGMSFFMLIINQHLHLEIARQKFFHNDYGKYRNHHLASSVNVTKNDSANSVKSAK